MRHDTASMNWRPRNEKRERLAKMPEKSEDRMAVVMANKLTVIQQLLTQADLLTQTPTLTLLICLHHRWVCSKLDISRMIHYMVMNLVGI